MEKIIYANGTAEVLVPAGQKIAIATYGNEYATLSFKRGNNLEFIQRLDNAQVTLGPWTDVRIVSIEAAQDPVSYDVGTAPNIDSNVRMSSNPITGGKVLRAGNDSFGLAQLSPWLLACIPARDTTTRFNDVTALGNNLVVEGGNSGAFATEGYFTTTASTTGGLNIPQSAIGWNPLTESLIFSFVLKRAAPAANENIFSIGAAIAGYQGVYLSHRTSGKLKIVGVRNNGALVAQNDSTLSFSDGTPKDRVVTVAFDAPTGSWYLWRDGVLSDAYVGAQAPGGANTFSDAKSFAELRVGGLSSASGSACVVVSGYGLQVAKITGSLPLNIGAIAARLAETPRVAIAGVELV